MPIIANNKYYILKANGKYYDIYNPFATFTFTINPTPADATVILTAQGYSQVGNSITVMRGTTVNWSVSKTDYVTQTGSSIVNSDETSNIVLELVGYPEGTVIFESSTAGTYNIVLDYDQSYELWLVGGGAGGTSYGSGRISISLGGGSGAYIHGTTQIQRGTYVATIGAGGANLTTPSYSTGGSTLFLAQEAGGGRGGGNTATTNVTLTGLTGTNGNATSSYYGAASVYGGYGAGGDAHSYGGSGYFKIVARR